MAIHLQRPTLVHPPSGAPNPPNLQLLQSPSPAPATVLIPTCTLGIVIRPRHSQNHPPPQLVTFHRTPKACPVLPSFIAPTSEHSAFSASKPDTVPATNPPASAFGPGQFSTFWKALLRAHQNHASVANSNSIPLARKAPRYLTLQEIDSKARNRGIVISTL